MTDCLKGFRELACMNTGVARIFSCMTKYLASDRRLKIAQLYAALPRAVSTALTGDLLLEVSLAR